MTPTLDRRQLLLAGSLAAAMSPTFSAPLTEADGREIELWPGGLPRGEKITVTERIEEPTPGAVPRDRSVWNVTRPVINVFEPRGTPNGITWLVIAGGGYRRVVIDREGFDTAAWLTERGFGAAVLRYRLPGDGWLAGPDAPVHDALRALRWLRGNASGKKLGIIGFSAGGHLAARVITEPALAYARIDALDELPARPDVAVLMYPVIHTTGEFAHAGSAQHLVKGGVAPTDLALSRFDPSLQAGAATPPTMLVHSVDDKTVPVENSLHMYGALRAAGVPSELHVFENGGHGFGLRGIDGKTVAIWPELARNWALAHARA
ncbi:MAG TPA: alpha/beta hydrolase [Steroidobacteraceae bacterium]|nr:alpha/beta hydrolase [Steroidobacteraceae bacterium]